MTAHELVKVMVADDHSLYRAGLRELLEVDEVKVVSEASTGEEAIAQALRTHPDVVVMDIRMPVMDGIEASREIKRQLPKTEIVMVSGAEDDEDQLFRAIDAGAHAYVGKDEDPRTIIEAVRTASHGGAYLPPHAIHMLMRRLSAGTGAEAQPPSTAAPSDARLTAREKEVLRLLAKGRRNQEIAQDLDLSVRSVGNHLAKVYNKLHIHGRAEAVLFAIRTGIASVD
ncbi:MAG TPA: response regulator transcription factor [Chloroflexota bacterium]|nr:response regulator transcription factor [Chloroflexota bacterium]